MGVLCRVCRQCVERVGRMCVALSVECGLELGCRAAERRCSETEIVKIRGSLGSRTAARSLVYTVRTRLCSLQVVV